MSHSPEVSIIVPCYNYGHLLSETLDSILAQTERNWECIIVDDESTDNTGDVAKNYVNADNRFRYVYQLNKGLAGARNTALKMATGKYIQLLDADDLLPPDKIKHHKSILDTDARIDLVYGRVYVFDKYASAIEDARELVLQEKISGSGLPVISALLEDNIFLVHCALFRKSMVEGVGLFHEEMITCEDWNFWFRCAIKGKQFLFVDERKSQVYARSHGKNMSANRKNMWIGKIRFHKEVAIMLEKRQNLDKGMEKVKKRNYQLELIDSVRYDLAYADLSIGIFNAIKLVFYFGNFSETCKDSLYWVRERIFKRL